MFQRRGLSVSLLAVLFGFAPQVQDLRAQDVAQVQAQGLAVLEKYCSSCHQQEKLTEKYAKEGAPKGFNYVLRPEQLLKQKKLIAGNPDSSPLFIRVAVKSDMPPRTNDECNAGTETPGTICYPNAKDIEALRNYISTLENPAEAKVAFISDDDIIRVIANDLSRFTDIERGTKRYLTLTHLHNIGEDPKAMELYRQGAAKLLNALSKEPDPVKFETIDPEKTIIRFDMKDLGWDAKIWDRIVAANPYTVIYDNPLFKDFVIGQTHSVTPILRADWFAFAAAKPPLYHEILGLPDTQYELEKLLGLSSLQNVNDYQVARAGFQHSGVSSNNRMIERHKIATGAFWASYDFAGNSQRQDFFRYPLGPQGALGELSEKHGFVHDGGEFIFSLPNGFHAYYLATAKGKRLDQGPSNIVIDNVTGRDDKLVTNGISCMGCHTEGIKYNPNRKSEAQDEVRESVQQALVLPPKVQEVVESLFPKHEKMAQLMKADAASYANALIAAGIDPKLRDKATGREPINVLFNRFEENVSARQAAAELGFEKDEFLRSLDAAGAEAYDLKMRLLRDSVPRDQFVAEFAGLVAALTKHQSYALDEVKEHADGVQLTVSSPNDKKTTFDLAFFPNGESFKVKETITFSLKSERDCYLNIYNVDQKGKVVFVFPNKFNQDNQIKANVKYQLPGDDIKGFKIRFKDAGKETFVAVCNATRPNPPGLEHDFAKSDFTEFETYRDLAAKTKSVELVKDDGGAQVSKDILAQKGVVLVVKKP